MPVISEWDGYSVRREFRNAVYNIEVRNPHKAYKGIRQIKVDGKEIEGNKVPIFSDDKIHEVEVTLG